MSGFFSLEEMKDILSHSMLDCGTELVNLVDCTFSFCGNNDPVLTHNSTEYVIKSEWVITQLCRVLGVTKKFWDRNPEELSEEIFKTHLSKLPEDAREVTLLFKSEGPQNFLRGIVPKDHFIMSNLEVLNVMEDHFGEDGIDSVFFVEGSGAYDPKFISAVISKETYKLSGAEYCYAVMTIASEVGVPELQLLPILLDVEKKNFFPLLKDSKVFSKHKYLAPENGTIVPSLVNKLNEIKEYFDCCLDDLRESLLEEMSYEDMLKTVSDWSSRRGFSKALSKKLSSNLTSLVNLDDEEESSPESTFETMGDLVRLTFETVASDKFESFLRGTMFISERLGFNYKID